MTVTRDATYWRALLMKYINLVGWNEGVSFIYPNGGNPDFYHLTEGEYADLVEADEDSRALPQPGSKITP